MSESNFPDSFVLVSVSLTCSLQIFKNYGHQYAYL